ncbi:MAG: hypothetical protein HYY06_25655 [Deltaproteobacteria bacterium]|nr:hypothetical protein [Deltaproteobacteria bacterium]
MRALGHPLVLLALGSPGWSCGQSTATEVLVRFHAGPDTIERAARFAFHVPGGKPPDGGVAIGSEALFPFTVPIVPKGGDASRAFEVVGHLDDDAGREISQERVVSGFEADRLLELAVCFDDRCLDRAPCPEGQTCDEGRCVDAWIPPGPAGSWSPCPASDSPDSGADAGGVPTADAGSCVDDECPEAPRIVGVAAGSYFTLALDEAGRLWSWGSNEDSRLGVGLAERDAPTIRAPSMVPLEAEAIDAGNRHGCVLSRGTVQCWGANDLGQLGLAGGAGAVATPVPAEVVEQGAFGSVAAGEGHTCALGADRALFCWGDNSSGQLGLGSSAPPPSPLERVDRSWNEVSAGRDHTCGIAADGQLFCWGANFYGQLGLGVWGSPSVQMAPTDPTGSAQSSWSSVSAGHSHTCAIKANGNLLCWGRNDDGRVGTTEGQIVAENAVRVPSPAVILEAGPWKMVSAGSQHTCATREDGALMCWGDDEDGQLGIGGADADPHVAPARVGSSADWERVAAGLDHTCAANRCGELYCWGANAHGQLGIGPDDQTRVDPVRVCWSP